LVIDGDREGNFRRIEYALVDRSDFGVRVRSSLVHRLYSRDHPDVLILPLKTRHLDAVR
jgi:hypothetical protein